MVKQSQPRHENGCEEHDIQPHATAVMEGDLNQLPLQLLSKMIEDGDSEVHWNSLDNSLAIFYNQSISLNLNCAMRDYDCPHVHSICYSHREWHCLQISKHKGKLQISIFVNFVLVTI